MTFKRTLQYGELHLLPTCLVIKVRMQENLQRSLLSLSDNLIFCTLGRHLLEKRGQQKCHHHNAALNVQLHITRRLNPAYIKAASISCLLLAISVEAKGFQNNKEEMEVPLLCIYFTALTL